MQWQVEQTNHQRRSLCPERTHGPRAVRHGPYRPGPGAQFLKQLRKRMLTLCYAAGVKALFGEALLW
jgi:hypothetical protein